MTFALVAVACSSLMVRDDMAVPAAIRYLFIRREPAFRYCRDAIRSMHGAYRVHEKASRVAPARPATHALLGPVKARGEFRTPASARCRPHGSRRSTG